MDLFKISWKNVSRNKRRSVLNIIALTIGIIMMLFYIGWMRGYFDTLYGSIINFETGHIQILKKGYLDEKRRMPLDITISEYNDLREKLLQDKRIKEITPRIDFYLMLSKGSDKIYLLGRAIDQEKEKQVTVLYKNVISGNYLSSAKQGILIGAPLARKLNISVGDTVNITAYNKYSNEDYIKPEVVGIFNFGYPVMDENVIFITNIETADSLLSLNGAVTRLVIKLKPGFSAEEVLPVVKEVCAGTDLEAHLWSDIARVVVSAVQGDSSFFWVMFIVIYIFIVVGILNSMSMSVYERVMEIGTLRAIGIRRSKLVRMFLFEGVSIALISSFFALILGAAMAAYLQFVGFDVGAYMPKDLPLPFGERFTASFMWYDFIIAVAFGVATALIGAILPAMRSAKINIAKAMSTRDLG